MNKFRKGLFYLAAAFAVSFNTSCQKDDTLQYNNATMGNIVDGRFVSDQGNIFNVTEQLCNGKLDTMKRAFVICDVLNKTASGAANEYDVRLNHIAYVLTKDVVTSADVKDEMAVQDPVHVEYAWVAGGYINLFIMFPVKVGSTTKHLINLVHEGEMTDAQTGEPVANTFRFTLRHNSYEDKITSDQESDYVLSGGYVSFPLNNYILAEEADFSIEWAWHKNAGAGLSSETEIRSLTGKYSTESYQHAPQISSTRAAANVK
jgi:hypothetical protein